MSRRLRTTATLLAVTLLAASAATAFAARRDAPPVSPHDDRVAGRACATPVPTLEETERAHASIRRWVEEHGAQAVGGRIKVVFHVIYSGSEGNIPQSQIDAQIAELNRNFAGTDGGFNTGYTFVLDRVTRTNRSKWFRMAPGSAAEVEAKNALSVDPARRLNIYSCKPNYLGWAYFPWSYAETSKMHGIVIHYGSVPGGYYAPYNLGRTATHEVGHYLGLYHTFQNGCNAPGDYVDDTPYQATSTSGCPIGKDTCPSPGVDPIHNYMDYSNDSCYREFTAGQDGRMDQMVPAYKPSLLNAPAPQAIAREAAGEASLVTPAWGIEFRGVTPNPFRGGTAIRFALASAGHVSLRIHDVAGRVVDTLVDGEMAAGEHSVSFRAGDLPPGTYFAALRAGDRVVNRRLVVIH